MDKIRTMSELEKKLYDLKLGLVYLKAEKKIDEDKLDKLESIEQIKRLMARYTRIQCRHDDPSLPGIGDSWKLFAPRDDSTLEIRDGGVFVGIEKIRRLYAEAAAAGPMKGCMYTRVLATPQMVVAGDGKTARCLWQTFGHETDPRLAADGGSEEGKPVINWVWGRIRADFIRIDGEWKIWHMHIYELFRCSYDKSWPDYVVPEAHRGGPKAHPALRALGLDFLEPDRPTTWHNPYSLTTEQFPIPMTPRPYETWSDEMEPV